MSRGIRKYSIVLRQRERVRRDDADVRLDVDERLRIEVLRIDDRVVDVREHLELVADAHVVAVRRHAVGDDAGAHLLVDERLDHLVLERHALDPVVGLDDMPSCVSVGTRRQQDRPSENKMSVRMINEIDVEREVEREVAAADVEVARQPAERHAEHHQQRRGRRWRGRSGRASCPQSARTLSGPCHVEGYGRTQTRSTPAKKYPIS